MSCSFFFFYFYLLKKKGVTGVTRKKTLLQGAELRCDTLVTPCTLRVSQGVTEHHT